MGLDKIDYRSFRIGLEIYEFRMFIKEGTEFLKIIAKSYTAIYLRFTRPQKIEIGTVDDYNLFFVHV